jgi:hypothetical protein
MSDITESKLYVNPYPVNAKIIFCDDITDGINHIHKKYGIVPLGHDADGFCFELNPYNFFVVIKVGKDLDMVLSIIVHELLHLTCSVLRSCGVVISRDSEEVLTYTQQDLFRHSVKLLKAYLKKRGTLTLV